MSNDALDFLKCCLRKEPSLREDAVSLLRHPFLKMPTRNYNRIFVSKRTPKNEALLNEILETLTRYIKLNTELGKKEPWTEFTKYNHEMRLGNISRWTGYSDEQIEDRVQEMYEKRTAKVSRHSTLRR